MSFFKRIRVDQVPSSEREAEIRVEDQLYSAEIERREAYDQEQYGVRGLRYHTQHPKVSRGASSHQNRVRSEEEDDAEAEEESEEDAFFEAQPTPIQHQQVRDQAARKSVAEAREALAKCRQETADLEAKLNQKREEVEAIKRQTGVVPPELLAELAALDADLAACQARGETCRKELSDNKKLAAEIHGFFHSPSSNEDSASASSSAASGSASKRPRLPDSPTDAQPLMTESEEQEWLARRGPPPGSSSSSSSKVWEDDLYSASEPMPPLALSEEGEEGEEPQEEEEAEDPRPRGRRSLEEDLQGIDIVEEEGDREYYVLSNVCYVTLPYLPLEARGLMTEKEQRRNLYDQFLRMFKDMADQSCLTRAMGFSYQHCSESDLFLDVQFRLPPDCFEAHLFAPVSFFKAINYPHYVFYYKNPALSLKTPLDESAKQTVFVQRSLLLSPLDDFRLHHHYQNYIFLEVEDLEPNMILGMNRPILAGIPITQLDQSTSDFFTYVPHVQDRIPLRTNDIRKLRFTLRNYRGEVLTGNSVLYNGKTTLSPTLISFNVHQDY